MAERATRAPVLVLGLRATPLLNPSGPTSCAKNLGGTIVLVDHQNHNLGALLRRRRQDAGLSLRTACVLFDVTSNTLHDWETGRRQPQPRHQRRIAEVLELLDRSAQ